MSDDVPDLSPGSRVGELSHAAQAAVQISSMRREAADRRGIEALRAAEEQVAQLDRVRSEWERLRRASEAALQLANDTRFEANHAMRVAASSRQHSDGAVIEYGDALQAPSGAVSAQELRRLEREVQLTARRAVVDAHLAERAVRASSKAGGQYDLVAFDQVKFERENGIESTGHERGLQDAAARPETAAARLLLDPADAARWTAVAEAERLEATGEFSSGAEQFGIEDDLTPPCPRTTSQPSAATPPSGAAPTSSPTLMLRPRRRAPPGWPSPAGWGSPWTPRRPHPLRSSPTRGGGPDERSRRPSRSLRPRRSGARVPHRGTARARVVAGPDRPDG